MTIDERVNDVMARLSKWVSDGAHKPFKWNDEICDFEYLGDEEIRRFVIEKIVEAGRQDGIEAEREACVALSDLIATRIWDYCQSVEWGTGKAMMAQIEIERIIEETIRARSESQHVSKYEVKAMADDRWHLFFNGQATGKNYRRLTDAHRAIKNEEAKNKEARSKS